MSAINGVTTVLLPNANTGRGHAVYPLEQAWTGVNCPHCGGVQALRVGEAAQVQWYRCATCLKGFVRNYGLTAPPRTPMRVPLGLPESDELIWEETRRCLGVGAYSAAVMLCRKLLLHTAVAHGLPAKDDNDRAPSYYQAVEYLQSESLITPKMRRWVDRIKDVGNDANHELEPIEKDAALDVAAFTEQLLVVLYEMDALMDAPDVAAPEAPTRDYGAGRRRASGFSI